MKTGHIAHAVCPFFIQVFEKGVGKTFAKVFPTKSLSYLQASSTATAQATVIWSIYAPTMGLLPVSAAQKTTHK